MVKRRKEIGAIEERKKKIKVPSCRQESSRLHTETSI
jgi:hypothetical protein